MAIKVSCQCGQSFAAKDELAGRTVKCPKCQNPLVIPAPAPASAAAPAPAAAPALANQPLGDLLDQEGFQSHTGVRCTRCNEPIPAGGVICVKCGFNVQTGTAVASSIRQGPKNVGHGEAADSILQRAAEELRKSPPPKDETAGGMVVSYVLTIAMVGITAAAGAGGYFLFRAMEGAPNKTEMSGLAMQWIGAGLIGIGWLWIVILGFMDRAVKGLLCLIPVYTWYYGFVKGHRFQIFLQIFGIVMALIGYGITILANQSDASKPVSAFFELQMYDPMIDVRG